MSKNRQGSIRMYIDTACLNDIQRESFMRLLEQMKQNRTPITADWISNLNDNGRLLETDEAECNADVCRDIHEMLMRLAAEDSGIIVQGSAWYELPQTKMRFSVMFRLKDGELSWDERIYKDSEEEFDEDNDEDEFLEKAPCSMPEQDPLDGRMTLTVENPALYALFSRDENVCTVLNDNFNICVGHRMDGTDVPGIICLDVYPEMSSSADRKNLDLARKEGRPSAVRMLLNTLYDMERREWLDPAEHAAVAELADVVESHLKDLTAQTVQASCSFKGEAIF